MARRPRPSARPSEKVRAPRLAQKPKAAWRQALGGRSHRQGHGAEWIAAVWLMLRGYQILGFRLKGRAEIDILARRGRILAVVEVKRRASMEAAVAALSDDQHRRLLAAGRTVLQGRPSLAGHHLRIDMVALAPGRLPRHIRGIGLKGGDIP